MRNLFLIFPILLFSCGETGTKTVSSSKKPDSIDSTSAIEKINPEEKVVELVENLPEVKKRMEEIDLNSHHKNILNIWISDGPEITKLKYYLVKVGEDNGVNTVTLFNFYVDPVSEEILFYDVIRDTLLHLEYWRDINEKGINKEK